MIYRHGLRVSEACDLRWDDIDLTKRTIIVRRLKGSTDSSHYLERDEHKALGELWRANAKKGIKSDYVFLNERGQPFGRMGIGRMIERAGEALPFPVHVHMLRHSTGYALAGRGMDTRRLQHYLACLDHEYSSLHRNVAGAVQGHLALKLPISRSSQSANCVSYAPLLHFEKSESKKGPSRFQSLGF
jgi:site-specific recombinase XerD